MDWKRDVFGRLEGKRDASCSVQVRRSPLAIGNWLISRRNHTRSPKLGFRATAGGLRDDAQKQRAVRPMLPDAASVANFQQACLLLGPQVWLRWDDQNFASISHRCPISVEQWADTGP